MPFFPKLGLLFIHIPRTSGRSVIECLSQHEPGPMLGITVVSEEDRQSISATWYNHATYAQAIGHLQRKGYTPRHCFSVVRHPLDRLVSWFFFRRQAAMFKHRLDNATRYMLSCPSFQQYARSQLFFPPPQVRWLPSGQNSGQTVELLRFENMASQWPAYLYKHNIPHLMLPHTHQTDHSKYLDYYDDGIARTVAESYREDFSVLNYSTAVFT